MHPRLASLRCGDGQGVSASLAFAGAAWLAACLCPAQACDVIDAEAATIASVIDGETLRLTDGRTVRLIGAKAPREPLNWRGEDPGRLLRRPARHLKASPPARAWSWRPPQRPARPPVGAGFRGGGRRTALAPARDGRARAGPGLFLRRQSRLRHRAFSRRKGRQGTAARPLGLFRLSHRRRYGPRALAPRAGSLRSARARGDSISTLRKTGAATLPSVSSANSSQPSPTAASIRTLWPASGYEREGRSSGATAR